MIDDPELKIALQPQGLKRKKEDLAGSNVGPTLVGTAASDWALPQALSQKRLPDAWVVLTVC